MVQQGNAPYPSAPYYQLYAEAPPTNTVVASAPPPLPQSAGMYQPPQQGIELQQYAAPTTTTTAANSAAAQSAMPSYPPNIPGQAVYPNEPVYQPSVPGMVPQYLATTAAVGGSDPNQGYGYPPTN